MSKIVGTYTVSATVKREVPVAVDSSGYIITTSGGSSPGEDAVNDWVSGEKASSRKYVPAKTATGAFTTVVDILASVEVVNYPNFTITVDNTSANALTTCKVYHSSDDTSWTQLTVLDADETACQTLAGNATGTAYVCQNNSYRYIKVTATAGAACTTDVWLTANAG